MIRRVCRVAVLSGVIVLFAAVLPIDIGSVWGASSIKIGVVDPQAVLERSKAGKRALGELKKFAEARQRILTAYEEELKVLEGELKDQSSTLPEKERQNKQEQFRGKVQTYQREAQKFNQELADKQRELVEEYMGKISAATKRVAEKRGLELVVDKGNENTLKIVIYNKESIDVTNHVVREFDRRFK